jgi:hypothetical protein
MKTTSGILVLAAAALSVAALAQDKKDRGKNAELSRKFLSHMEANGRELKGLKDDAETGKPEADLKKRLARIRGNTAAARALKYRKSDEEAELLDNHFEIFELKLKKDFEDVEWGAKEQRLELVERLKAKCDVCHAELRQ